MSSMAAVFRLAVSMMPKRLEPVDGGERKIVADRHRQHQALGLPVLRNQRHADVGDAAAFAGLLSVDRLARLSRSCQSQPLSTPKSASRSSRCPCPSRPPRPTTSPGRMARLMSLRRPVQTEFRHSSTGRASRSVGAPVSAGRRSCIRGRSSSRRCRRRSWCRRQRSPHCGRCGTPCSRRQAPRSRACGARCRASRGLGAQPLQHCEHLVHVGTRSSAEVASSRIRMRGLRASALAISTICRRDSGRSLTSAERMDVGGADPRQHLRGDLRSAPAVDQADLLRRIGDEDVVGDAEFGNERQFLEYANDARLVGLRRRGESRPPPVQLMRP